jgi:hypothetical protein
MRSWNEFNADPRISYYRFLREGYACRASVAYGRVKRIDAMVLGLSLSSPPMPVAASFSAIVRFFKRVGAFAARAAAPATTPHLSARRVRGMHAGYPHLMH